MTHGSPGLIVLLIGCGGAPGAAPVRAPQAAPFAVVLSATEARVAGVKVVRIAWSVTDVREAVDVTTSPFLADTCTIVVRRVVGSGHKEVPLTQLGKRNLLGLVGAGSAGGGPLAPGNSKSLRLGPPINHLYDMTLPGRYAISVRQRAIRPDGQVLEVESNTVQVTVDHIGLWDWGDRE